MDTELQYQKIVAHVAGLTEQTKPEFISTLQASKLKDKVKVIDLDDVSSKIVDDKNMSHLLEKYETLKGKITEQRQLETKIGQYWKSKLEYALHKLLKNEVKPLLFIGYSTFFRNHKIGINFEIPERFFVQTQHESHAKNIIKSNLDQYRKDIINGTFDLNYLDLGFLMRRRAQIESVYVRNGYIVQTLKDIVNSIEFSQMNATPTTLYMASVDLFSKRVPAGAGKPAFAKEAYALIASMNSEDFKLVKKVKGGVEVKKAGYKQLKKSVFFYEIMDIDSFVPVSSPLGIAYVSRKPFKIRRYVEIEDILSRLKEMGMHVNLV